MRKSRLGLITVVEAETDKKVPQKKEKKDKIEYTEIITPRELEIAEGVKLVFSVTKSSEGNPHIDIRTYIESEKYSGPTKKGINFDIENMEEFLEILNEVNIECQNEGV